MESQDTSLRSRLKFHDEPEEENLSEGRYKIRYQGVDDRKSQGEVKAEGDAHPWLFEVFDGDELTYETQVGFREDYDRRVFLENLREAVRTGRHNSKRKP